MSVPLSVLDLVPISSGSTVAQAVRNTIDLAQQAERFGYRRYWFAEHHLNPGVAAASPALLAGLVAGATGHIRLGSAGVQLGQHPALSAVEDFGLLDALHPGRFDLGLGRSGPQLFRERAKESRAAPPPPPAQVVDGLLIPAKPNLTGFLDSARLKLTLDLTQLPGAQAPDYGEQVADLLALLAGTYRSAEGLAAHAVPGEGANLQVWILGSSGGQSAVAAGRNGLRFAANYHVSPASILEAVAAYRAAFRPSASLDRPYVAVSADVVVADDDEVARTLAAGYAAWVRSIRRAEGAILFPTPEEAAALTWTHEDRTLVADRVDTQFVGSAETVAAQLGTLQRVTAADELVVTTVTHDHADRVRSFELLAKEWINNDH
jgi:alkanesulfonate monooxygenase SsuD/methylene tetrahydromethanopterin reductase-like flavin-dependent oxidoreductase (luciferase family)